MRSLFLTLALLLAGPALAHGGDDGASAAPAGAALPRFTAETELFELVGVLDGHQLRLWLDHAASNAPVENAELALELNGQPVALKAMGAGEFEAELADDLAPGTHPVTATVTAGAESDLLAGEFDIHAEAAGAAAHTDGWRGWAPWAGGAAVLLLAAMAFSKRRSANLGAAA